MPISGASNYNFDTFNTTRNYSFVASTTNITSIKNWLIRTDVNPTYCTGNYIECGASDFSVLSIYSDSSFTSLVASTTLLWSNVPICSDGNSSNYRCDAWSVTNDQEPAIYTFSEPVVLTPSSTYYVTITAPFESAMGFKTWNSDYAYQMYYDDAYSASNDYILYYGDNPAYTILGQNYQLPVVYNICDSWQDEESWYISLINEIGTSTHIFDGQLLTSCSGTIIYNQPADTLVSDTGNFIIYNGLDPEIAISNEFLNVVYQNYLSDEDYIYYYYPNNLYIDTSAGNGTSTINFAYSVCSDTNFASSTIKLKSVDGWTTNLEYIPTACTASAFFEFPYLEDTDLILPVYFSYQNNGQEYIRSKAFSIVLTSDQDLIANLGEDATSTSAAEEYNSGWTRKLLNVFPFSFIIGIKTAWYNSEYAVLNDSLALLDVADENNEITGTLPAEWFGTTTEIVILGESTITANSADADSMWVKVKQLTTWIQWFLFAWGLWAFAQFISKKLSNKPDTYDSSNT